MKKISILIAAMLIMNTVSVFAEDAETAKAIETGAIEAEVIEAGATETEIIPEVLPAEEPEALQPEVAQPTVITDIPVVIDGSAKSFQNPVIMKNGIFLVPFEETAKSFRLRYTFSGGIHKATAGLRSLSVDSLNNIYIYNALQIPELPAEIINGTLYIPVNMFIRAFNLDMIFNSESEKPTLYLASSSAENAELNAGYVNSTGLGSNTPYFIWVSKSDYKVRVFLGESGSWHQINSFTCGIGAPATPTCEGTYKYYQAQKMWDYGSYYVGPVMRFNGGYAIHSTLLYKNGTPMDNRVGIRLSHGCVRLRPDDINWLAYYIPLGTTIHITG